MPVKQTIPYSSGSFFITFTCYEWLPLIDKINGYDIVYRWFDILKNAGHYLNGYVIMPNHVHAMISFIKSKQSINTIIGNGKRFMAYEIIERLKNKNEKNMLDQLCEKIENKRKLQNKRHNVWKLSFDWKECLSARFKDQKLEYMHLNPCSGKWNLCNEPSEYPYSSALFYYQGKQGVYPVTNIAEMEDVCFE